MDNLEDEESNPVEPIKSIDVVDLELIDLLISHLEFVTCALVDLLDTE